MRNIIIDTAGNNGDMVKHAEELLSVWHRQIEQVLTQSEQVRREADDVGPSAELMYWKSRMAEFNWSVLPACLAIVLCL